MKLPFSRSKASPTGKSVPDLPFGSEDVVEVTRYGHLDVSCGRIEATVILNSGDKLIKLEALKKRWEFYKEWEQNSCIHERYQDFKKQYPELAKTFMEDDSAFFNEWLLEFCIGSLLKEKEADK